MRSGPANRTARPVEPFHERSAGAFGRQDPDALRALGRIHGPEEALRSALGEHAYDGLVAEARDLIPGGNDVPG